MPAKLILNCFILQLLRIFEIISCSVLIPNKRVTSLYTNLYIYYKVMKINSFNITQKYVKLEEFYVESSFVMRKQIVSGNMIVILLQLFKK